MVNTGAMTDPRLPDTDPDAPTFSPTEGQLPPAGQGATGSEAGVHTGGDRADGQRPDGDRIDATDAHGTAAYAPLIEDVVQLANRWARATEEGQTKAERATTGQLAALVRNEAGLDLAVRFVDRVARPEDTTVAARELGKLSTKNASGFLGGIDRAMLGLGALVAPLAPPVVVPLARMRLRQIIGHLVVDSNDPALGKHLAKARKEGFRLNVNLLGEAVLGEAEAASRTERVGAMLARPDVDYVSIKVSSLVSQIITWDHDGTVERCLDRLRPLYRTARSKSPHAFVNLDMEEYRDLDLTMDLFMRLLSEEEFKDLEAGIVLQAYLPDALPAIEELVEFAQKRRAAGGAGIKIRLVKGANLAMEHVEAAVHGWALAPYGSKPEVDANYLRCVERVLRPELAGAVRLGVASHNLYDVAAAHLLAQARGVSDALDIEMLQGMAPAQARAVKADVGTVLLYTPVVAPEDFDVAVSYLIRRLEENAQKENFLYAIFSGEDGMADPGSPAMVDQEQRFRDSVAAIDTTRVGPSRSFERPRIPDTFDNTADSDPSLPGTRAWARAALDAPERELTSPVLPDPGAVDAAVARGVAARPGLVADAGGSARGDPARGGPPPRGARAATSSPSWPTRAARRSSSPTRRSPRRSTSRATTPTGRWSSSRPGACTPTAPASLRGASCSSPRRGTSPSPSRSAGCSPRWPPGRPPSSSPRRRPPAASRSPARRCTQPWRRPAPTPTSSRSCAPTSGRRAARWSPTPTSTR